MLGEDCVMSTLSNLFEYLDHRPRIRVGVLMLHTALVLVLVSLLLLL
jgi:hypothetical protein